MNVIADINAMVTLLLNLRMKYFPISGTWVLGTFKPLFLANVLSYILQGGNPNCYSIKKEQMHSVTEEKKSLKEIFSNDLRY
jgi:hypothetical protein